MGQTKTSAIVLVESAGQRPQVPPGSDPVVDDATVKIEPGAIPAPTVEAADQDEEQEQWRSQRAPTMQLVRRFRRAQLLTVSMIRWYLLSLVVISPHAC